MTLTRSLVLSTLFFLISCSGAQKQNSDLAAFFDRFWEERSKLFPLDATQQGDHRYNHLLPNDQSPSFREELRAFYERSLKELKSYDRTLLSDNDRASYDMFEYDLTRELEGLKLNFWMIPFQQFWGLPLLMGQ